MTDTVELANCREAFEMWFCQDKTNCPSITRDVNGGDGYNLMSAHQAWQAWKAAWEFRHNAGAVDAEALKQGTPEELYNTRDVEFARRGLLKSQEGGGE